MSDEKLDPLKMLDDDFRQKVEEYQKINWKKLLRKEDLKHHLGEIEPHLEFIRRVLDYVLNSLCAKHSPDTYMFEFRSQVAGSLETWLGLQRDILQHTDYNNNEKIVKRVREYRHTMLKHLQPVLERFELEEKYTSPKGQAEDFRGERQKIQEEINKMRKLRGAIDQENMLAAKQVAGQVAKQFGSEFEEEAKHHKKLSYIFGGALLLFVAAVVWAIYCKDMLSFNLSQPATNWLDFIVQSNLMFKIFVLACFFHITNILSREYMAHRHQMVVNKHRANAINSYQALNNSVLDTDSDADKKAAAEILVELTKFLYSTHITGFVKNAEAGKTQNLQVVDTASRVLGGRYDKS